jgi:glutathione synthase/RimK-type ligase-like ATP-grasp enzyme
MVGAAAILTPSNAIRGAEHARSSKSMTQRHLLVLGAGGGPGNNLIRSLRVGDPSLLIVGAHRDRFLLKNSAADRNYLVPATAHPDFINSLAEIVGRDSIDLIIPTSDSDVRALAMLRDRLPCRTFLPTIGVIDLCRDKYELNVRLRKRGVPAPETFALTTLEDIDDIFGPTPHRRLWCRTREGHGGRGALLVESPEQARAWIQYWNDMRGVVPSAFTLSEYLPGRDFAAQSLWHDGELVIVKNYERLSALGGGQPGSTSSLAALSRTVVDPRVPDVTTAAMRALDRRASGVFCWDLRENADGVLCVTEINAGRFGLSTNIFDLPGKHNMAVTYVRLALGEGVGFRDHYDAVDDYYMIRDYDTVPTIFHADELFENVEVAPTPPR